MLVLSARRSSRLAILESLLMKMKLRLPKIQVHLYHEERG